ncbi:fatty acid--CoA ligase [Sphingopyxis sp. Q841]|uniref:fatty acid--CoA ligase n=1 Tax=Sphingopyxis sp. Q841 TaxID=3458250 RepID=UPI004036860D
MSVNASASCSQDSSVPTVSSLIARHAQANPDRLALRFEESDLSYAALEREVARTAAALEADGVAMGDRIAYYGKNSAAYFLLLYGAARLGAVMVPIGWRLASAEVEYIVNDTEARLLFVESETAAIGKYVSERAKALRRVISVGGAEDPRAFETFLAGALTPSGSPVEDPDTVFLQLYTSGTTGKPKGVMLTARNIFAMRMRCKAARIDWDIWGEDEVALIAMPVGHIGGSGYGLMALFHGATGLIVREFTPEIVLETIRNERVSKFFIVPTALQILVRHPEARSTDYSRVRHILYGASPMPLPLLQEAIDVIGAGLVQQYGMTETSGTIVALGAEDHDVRGNERMKSAGKPLPGVEIRILGDEGEVLGANEVGEIATRSDANMAGYWKLPEATGSTVDADGWLRTGDAGYLDPDGYLYICDRVKDMVLTGGENVYPAEVEAVLYAHPQVAEAAVIGVPDEKWGEAVKAIIVAKPDAIIAPEDLIAFTRERLAGFKAPKSIDIVDTLPRNASGKILKKELREPYWAGRNRQVN